MEDYYYDGFNSGYGRNYLNDNHEYPQNDGDKYSYRAGYEDGQRRRKIKEELEDY